MPHLNTHYDVIIIGAGMSGLVSGCFLAKAGMKVLIIEQHNKPGGYCTSFKRGGITFDAAAHSFGGIRHGNIGDIFQELSITKKIKIKHFNPSDTVIAPGYKVCFWSDLDQTVEGFQAAFPDERKNLRNFFNFLIDPPPLSFARMRRWTFHDLLEQHFCNAKLKTILSLPLCGIGGLPPSQMSAFIGAKIYQGFLLDGGYYPEGGMQVLSDALAERFQEFGGELRLSQRIIKIETEDAAVTGVVAERDGFIPSQFVISNCDARQTFLNLLAREVVGREFLNKIINMTQTLSTFIIYLGFNKFSNILPKRSNIWFLSHYNLDQTYISAQKGDLNDIGRYLIHPAPEQKTLVGYLNAPFKDKKYWDDNKEIFLEAFIKKIETHTIPGLSRHILHKEASTPYTLFRYTLNYKGAACGWENTPAQLSDPDLRRPPFVQRLYLTGHWTTHGLGISGVSYLGYTTAKLVLKEYKKRYSQL